MRERKEFGLSRYITLTEEELIGLVVCVALDVVEYILSILLLPLVGDIIDLGGITFSLYYFKWIGLLTLLEFVPGGDLLPLYIITWLVWYSLRKVEETRGRERFR